MALLDNSVWFGDNTEHDKKQKEYEDAVKKQKEWQVKYGTPEKEKPNGYDYEKHKELSTPEEVVSVDKWLNSTPEERSNNLGEFRQPGYYNDQGAYTTWLTQDLSPENPLPWQQYLPGETKRLADQQFNRAEGDYKKSLMAGVNKPMARPPQSPMSQAIGKKYQKMSDVKMRGIAQDAGNRATAMTSRAQQSASEVYGQKQKILMQNFREQWDFQEKRKQAFDMYVSAKNQATMSFYQSLMSGIPLVGGALGYGYGTAATKAQK